MNGEITSYAWLPTHNLWADILTKEKKVPLNLKDVLIRNQMNLGDTTINKVMAFAQEVQMKNICNRKISLSPNTSVD